MNVFVLGTGRCGSETFARACCHITNYSARHETHNIWLHSVEGVPYRDLRFPDRHIEVDNRLSWFLGTLEREYGHQAYYVHLLRDREQVARSLLRRGDQSVLYGFAHSFLQYYGEARWLTEKERYQIALQFWDTVNGNIEGFLRDKPRTLTIWLHEAPGRFARFWKEIGAEGDMDAAIAEWGHQYNQSRPDRSPVWCAPPGPHTQLVVRAVDEIISVIPEGDTFALLDEETLGLSFAPAGRRRVAFPESKGQYAGPPATEAALTSAVDGLLERGIRYLVIAWPAFWWINHYDQFRRKLLNAARALVDNERLKIYALDQ